MKLSKLFGGLIVGLLGYLPVVAQTASTTLVSHGYYKGMNFADSMIIKAEFQIIIAPKEVTILALREMDSSVYLQRRTMSGIKYTTLDARTYQVWKLGDRKMVLRELDGQPYLSLYRTDDYGLPAEYITFIIED